jgi:hypothetical protein
MAKDKFATFSGDKLFKMLKESNLNDKEKQKVERLIKCALLTEEQELLSAINDALLLKKKSSYGPGQPSSGDITFFLGSHIAVYGQPGTGKSMAIMGEIARLKNNGNDDLTIFVPDLEGDYSRVLPSLIEPGDVIVLTEEDIKKNILENVEISRQWLGMFAKPWAEASYIGDSGFILMTNTGRRLSEPELVERMDGHATYSEVCEDIETLSTAANKKLKQYQEGTFYRLNYFNGNIGKFFSNRRGHSPYQLRGKVIVYDYSSLE